MLKFTRIPLLFLFLGSLLGVCLRWQIVFPTPGVNYTYFLHGHSHIMFLGWIFNVLFLGFTSNHIAKNRQTFFRMLFIILQVFVVGMMISFPLQGYGFYSILFSTLHTLGAIFFIVKFFKETKHATTTSAWYASISLLFFIVSAAGPMLLGYLMANGLAQSNWYYFAIYFYLHFQYNGFFIFGIFSLFFDLVESRKINFSLRTTRTVGIIFAVVCIPAYGLSVLWAKPGNIFNISGAIVGLIQLYAVILLGNLLRKISNELKAAFSKSSFHILIIVFIAFALKLVLQFISAFPAAAQLAYELRPIVIAYIHLVLIGVITLFIFVWYVESGLINKRFGSILIVLFTILFAAMELCLILNPWWSTIFGAGAPSATTAILFFSAALSICCLLSLVFSFNVKLTKISF